MGARMCKWGTDALVKLAHPMPVSGRTEIVVDACIAPLVQMLNDYGVHTTGCCCGHENGPGSILYEQDGNTHELRLPISERPRQAFSLFVGCLVLVLLAACGPLRAMVEPRVYVCESDGELVAPKDIRNGQRIEDGCYVHRMRASEACSIARCA